MNTTDRASSLNVQHWQWDASSTAANSSSRVQPCTAQSISLGDSYDLYNGDVCVGSIYLRKIEVAGAVQCHTNWSITAKHSNLKFQSENFRQTPMPDIASVVTELSQSADRLQQISGNEYAIEKGGSCTELTVQRGNERKHVFQKSGPLAVITSTGKNTGKIEPVSQLEALLTEPEFMRLLSAKLHHQPDLKQIFMFGPNYEQVLKEVYENKTKSSLYSLLNPLSVAKLPWTTGYILSTYCQELVPLFEGGKLSAVVQKDPEDDPEPCGYEFRFTPGSDGKYWQEITFISPDKSALVAKLNSSSGSSPL